MRLAFLVGISALGLGLAGCATQTESVAASSAAATEAEILTCAPRNVAGMTVTLFSTKDQAVLRFEGPSKYVGEELLGARLRETQEVTFDSSDLASVKGEIARDAMLWGAAVSARDAPNPAHQDYWRNVAQGFLDGLPCGPATPATIATSSPPLVCTSTTSTSDSSQGLLSIARGPEVTRLRGETAARFDFQVMYETRHAPLAASGVIKAALASRRELSVADTSVGGVRATLQYQPPFNTSLGALLIDGDVQSWPAFLALDASLTCADKR